MLVEPDHVGPGLGGGWRLHVGQVLCISQVSQHVLQLGPVWPCLTGQFKGVSKQTNGDGEWRKTNKLKVQAEKEKTDGIWKKSSTEREENN